MTQHSSTFSSFCFDPLQARLYFNSHGQNLNRGSGDRFRHRLVYLKVKGPSDDPQAASRRSDPFQGCRKGSSWPIGGTLPVL